MIKKNNMGSVSKTTLVLIVFILSVVLYLAGVWSGLSANKVLEERTEAELLSLQYNTTDQIEGLRNSISFIQDAIQEYQIEQEFISVLDEEDKCRAQNISLTNLLNTIQGYRQTLPYRLEEFEQKNELTKEYMQLKEEYNRLSIQAWIVAKSISDTCDTNIIHALYFYNATCSSCIKQGEQLDVFTSTMEDSGFDVLLFTIDSNSDESVVKLIREQYGVEAMPAVLLSDVLYEGRVFMAIELVQVSE